jgi:hypothetical protein
LVDIKQALFRRDIIFEPILKLTGLVKKKNVAALIAPANGRSQIVVRNKDSVLANLVLMSF